jgi:hypothetical protein
MQYRVWFLWFRPGSAVGIRGRKRDAATAHDAHDRQYVQMYSHGLMNVQQRPSGV